MGIWFFLIVNKQGQTRFSKYYRHSQVQSKKILQIPQTPVLPLNLKEEENENIDENSSHEAYFQKENELYFVPFKDRALFEAELARKCLRNCGTMGCSFFQFRNHKIVFRKFASLYFILGTDPLEVFLFLFIFRTHIHFFFPKFKLNKNELSLYEFLELFVEILDNRFKNVV